MLFKKHLRFGIGTILLQRPKKKKQTPFPVFSTSKHAGPLEKHKQVVCNSGRCLPLFELFFLFDM